MSKLNGNDLLMRYRMRYRKARARKERSGILDEFCYLTGISSRKHAIRLLNGNQKEAEGSKRGPGRKKVYDSVLFKEELISIWRDLSRPASLHLKASIPTIIHLKELHGYSFDPETKELLLEASRSTIERILAPIRQEEKGLLPRRRYGSNPLMKEIPLAIDYPRPDEPGHLQVDLAWFSGGEASGHYIHAVVVIDRYLLWVEVEPCMGRSREAVLSALKEALSRMPCRPKTLQTDNGPEFLNDHLRFFCRKRNIKFIRSRPYKKNDNAHVEGSIGNIIRKELGYLRYETPEALEIMREICRGPMRWIYNFLRPTARYTKESNNGRTIRRYDQMRTPLARVCERKDISDDTKDKLVNTLYSINPNRMNERKEALLVKLFRCARRTGASEGTGPLGDTNKPCLVPSSAQKNTDKHRLAQN